MSKKQVVALLGTGLLLMFLVCLFRALYSKPRYDGKTVFELTRVLSYSPGQRGLHGVTDAAATNALVSLRTLGPHGEKALIRQLQTKDTIWRRTYTNVWAWSPPFARQLLPPPVNATYHRQLAVCAIGHLGALSAQIEHALVLACGDTDLLVRAVAASLLGYNGSRSPEVLLAVNTALRDGQIAPLVQGRWGYDYRFKPRTVEEMIAGLDRPFREARYQAASALRDLGPHARPAIPALIAACSDEYDTVRVCSARALGRIGVAASNAIPTLQALTKHKDSFVRAAAAEAIEQIQHPSPQKGPR